MKKNRFAVWWMKQPEWKLLYVPDAVIGSGMFIFIFAVCTGHILGCIFSGITVACVAIALYNIVGSCINIWCIGKF